MDATARPGDANRVPVVILSSARSGSTLLRFLLDSHPDFACPPETRVPATCAQLAFTWSALENAGSGRQRLPDQPVPLSGQAVAAIRSTVDEILSGYLRSRGKRRWCDKSQDSYRFAHVIAQIYPEAQFIVLTRHCMDVIASVIELSPWNLQNLGLDDHVARHPGNSVAAVAEYWLACAGANVAFSDAYPERCLRVRYEDLVTAPEETASSIFGFLGARQVPGITRECFRVAHDRDGAGDEKIWLTSSVSTDSVGRGTAVPAAGLGAALREQLNQLLARLRYRTVDERWNDSALPVDPRADAPACAGVSGERAGLAAAVGALRDRATSRQRQVMDEIIYRWPAVSGLRVTLVVETPGQGREEIGCRLAPAETAAAGPADAAAEPRGPGAVRTIELTGSPQTWLSVLAGRSGFVAEVAAGRLCAAMPGGAARVRSDELHAIGVLLGLATTIPVARGQGVPAADPARVLLDGSTLNQTS
jgi:hypothetical protein